LRQGTIHLKLIPKVGQYLRDMTPNPITRVMKTMTSGAVDMIHSGVRTKTWELWVQAKVSSKGVRVKERAKAPVSIAVSLGILKGIVHTPLKVREKGVTLEVKVDKEEANGVVRLEGKVVEKEVSP